MLDTPAERALDRVALAARRLSENGFSPGADVSLYRALRELHRVLGQDDTLDPNRLVRWLLFRGLSETESGVCPGVYECPSSHECSECGLMYCDHAGCIHD